MKVGITELAVLSLASTSIKISLVGKFCCSFPFFSCWKSRGALARGERVAGKMGRQSERGEAHRRGWERDRKRQAEPTARG